MWLVLLWLVTMLLYLVASTDTVSPTSRFSTAEPEVTRKPSDVSHIVMWPSLPFISRRHTWKKTTDAARSEDVSSSVQTSISPSVSHSSCLNLFQDNRNQLEVSSCKKKILCKSLRVSSAGYWDQTHSAPRWNVVTEEIDPFDDTRERSVCQRFTLKLLIQVGQDRTVGGNRNRLWVSLT